MIQRRPAEITNDHLARKAVGYQRVSTPGQAERNLGSLAVQTNQVDYALAWGWRPSDIETLDVDLGLSATSGDQRIGWQSLLRRVRNREIGIILCSDTSRLSRNTMDFEELLRDCWKTDTLFAVEGKIVDPTDRTDRFTARIRANVAELDNDARTESLRRAARAKARLGHAVTRPPTGYEQIVKGRWEEDRDGSVREAIGAVFQHFDTLGTVGRVLRFYVENDLKLPVRYAGEVRWLRPNRTRIHHILTNPAFKGTYTLGRHSIKCGTDHADGRRTDETGVIVVPDHHEPYIDPATWDRIQERLRSNQFAKERQPPGGGPALCQGIIRCGRCGRNMSTHYYYIRDGIRFTYSCVVGRQVYGEPVCWSVNGPRVDEVVVTELLRSLTPPQVEAVIVAAGDVNERYVASQRQREAELARAEYDLQLAKRRYYSVDPENRPVAAALERDWGQAEQRLCLLKQRHVETPLTPPLELTPDVLATIRRIGEDLLGVWSAPSTTDHDRKTLLRLFITEVRVVSRNDIDFQIDVAWVGKAVTRHTILHPWGPAVMIRQLAAQGVDNAHIAEELNRRLARTLHRRAPYSTTEVRSIFQCDARRAKRGQGIAPWNVRREVLRTPLTELIEAGWSEAAIAVEFNRRKLPGYFIGTPWTLTKVRDLRRALDIPAEHESRAYQETFRAPLMELLPAGWTDRAIADEFNRRGLRGLTCGEPWSRTKVRTLRQRFGIRSQCDWRQRRETRPAEPATCKGD